MASLTLYPLPSAAACGGASGVRPAARWAHVDAVAHAAAPPKLVERCAAGRRAWSSGARRHGGVTARAAAPDAPPRLGRPVIEEHVARAAATLDQMLSTIMREMFVDQAAAFVTDEKPELEQCQVRQA